MSLALACLFGAWCQSGSVLPMAPYFRIGDEAESQFVILCVEGAVQGRIRDRSGLSGTEFSSSFGSVITRKSVRNERNGNRVYLIAVPKKVKERVKLELITDSSDRPLFSKSLDAKSDELDRFALLLRQPLFPKVDALTNWETTLPNPHQGEAPISVHCSASTIANDIILKQIVDSVVLDGGKTYIEVTMKFDVKSGRLKKVYEWVEHGGKDERNPATVFIEMFK
jgi:hypothetical protein